MSDDIVLKGLPHKKLSKIVENLRKKVFKNEIVKDIFDKYDITPEELELIPICFAKIPVSARTDHGIIYLNIDLLEDDDFYDHDDHYLAHEVTHFAQQTTGDKPTPSSDGDDYLDNPIEQESFQNQSKYISDTQGDDVAELYIEKVLDTHDSSENVREQRKEELFAKAIDLYYRNCIKLNG
jgi:hypothetical protein